MTEAANNDMEGNVGFLCTPMHLMPTLAKNTLQLIKPRMFARIVT